MCDSSGGRDPPLMRRASRGHLRGCAEIERDRYADWNEVYSDNVTWVYRWLYARVGNRSDAEDLTAGVFLAALGPLRIGAHRGEVRSYLGAAARSQLAGHWRRVL